LVLFRRQIKGPFEHLADTNEAETGSGWARVQQMIFSSPLFIFFFLPIFVAAYFLGPARVQYRNSVALLGSILFFAWGEPFYVFFLIASTAVDYAVASAVRPGAVLVERYRRLLVAALIILNVGILFYFKYYQFFLGQFTAGFGAPTAPSSVVSLLGISFITFHKISFIVDIYTGRARLPRHVFDYALYLFLFPQLIAGPIIRFHDIGDQIAKRQHTADGVLLGLLIFSIGLAKKVLIADPLGRVSDQVFALPPDGVPTLFAWGGVLCYTFQIYFDFSGYSEMAIGLGRIMGFSFPANFNRPYLSRSITEFWQRWHITLSNWMRLYLYIPLGGNRVSPLRLYLNLWIVFLVSGLWHGANWTFVFWGAYFGFFLSVEKAMAGRIPVLGPAILRQLLTFLIVVVGWVFFRADSFAQAVSLLNAMLGIKAANLDDVIPWGWVFDRQALVTLAIAAGISLIPWHHLADQRWARSLLEVGAQGDLPTTEATVGRFALAALLLFSATATLVSLGYTPFLYFRF
jgi:alginate O-acetyltransferase complex protein AlgI